MPTAVPGTVARADPGLTLMCSAGPPPGTAALAAPAPPAAPPGRRTGPSDHAPVSRSPPTLLRRLVTPPRDRTGRAIRPAEADRGRPAPRTPPAALAPCRDHQVPRRARRGNTTCAHFG